MASVGALPASWYSSRLKQPDGKLRYEIAGFHIYIKRDGRGDVNAFHQDQNSLVPVHVKVGVNGVIWVNLDAKEKPEVAWEEHFRDIDKQERYKALNFADYESSYTYDIDGYYNRKILAYNFNECYHFPITHLDIPEFLNLTPSDSDLKDGHIQHRRGSTPERIAKGINTASTYYFSMTAMVVSSDFIMAQALPSVTLAAPKWLKRCTRSGIPLRPNSNLLVTLLPFTIVPGPDPNDTIPEALAGISGILESAAREEGIKRLVLTSSSIAVLEPGSSKRTIVTWDTWNEKAAELAWSPPYAPDKSMAVYAASKVIGEKAMWDWVDDRKLRLGANSGICPNILRVLSHAVVLGSPLSTKNQDYPSTLAIPIPLLNIDQHAMNAFIDQFPAYAARLHVAALIHADVEGERIFAFAGPFNRNDILAVFRKLRHHRRYTADIAGLTENRSIVGLSLRHRADGLLKHLWGIGFASPETCRETIQDPAQ
ncbi:hypothetical protein BDV30DRAFT_234706 [Aspergillus minisclerotigenes]|uniref:Choline monooxygenase, chloroplastic n=1 Tax=Aspergillus minisclerotigenes TaxID=656917 RepID=A0A5N6JHX0_9EURO|nr:hypothetical protein BDV30DRAFT_234706 [Aspergillus minisclerotigenes]